MPALRHLAGWCDLPEPFRSRGVRPEVFVRILAVSFALALAFPLLWHWFKDQTPPPYFAGAFSAEELDQAYLQAVANAHVSRAEARGVTPLLVAGIAEKCFAMIPEYDGCNHQEVMEAAHVCAGRPHSWRLHANRQIFPRKVGSVQSRRAVVLTYWWDPAEGRAGGLNFAYQFHVPEEECVQHGGEVGRSPWGGYTGCIPNHEVICSALSTE